jgi:adenylylsulfate kinase-like enzyme
MEDICMSALNILVVGDRGAGKSTAARVITQALVKAGFHVELTDKDDISEAQFGLRLAALQGTSVRVTCGNVKVRG